MNDIVYKQLGKCRVARLPMYDKSTTHLIIDKLSDKNGASLVPSHYYIIKLDDFLLSKEQSAILHQNWNNNLFPQSNCYKCECVKVMGGMVKIEGIGYNLETKQDIMQSWGGWLPSKNITVIEELPI